MNKLTPFVNYVRKVSMLRAMSTTNLIKLEQIEEDYMSIMAHKHCTYGVFKANKFFAPKRKTNYSYLENANCFDRRPKFNKKYLDSEDEYLTKMAHLHIRGQ